MLILITYDINITTPEGQRHLRKVAKQCVNYGVRVQNSVFECRVDTAQYTRLRHALLGEIDDKQDSLRFDRLGDNAASKVEHYGVERGLQVEEPLIL